MRNCLGWVLWWVIVLLVTNTSCAQTITTYAGTGSTGSSSCVCDSIAATAADLYDMSGLTFSYNGNLFISDNGRIRIIDTSGTIYHVAGTGASSYSGDGGDATAAALNIPQRLAFDPRAGNLFFADQQNHVIRKIDLASNVITTYAGTPGTFGYYGDGGAATSAELNQPNGVAFDGLGNLYIADAGNNVIRKVDTRQNISTIAGSYSSGAGYSGDGSAATSALLNNPLALKIDPYGSLLIVDQGNSVIRKVNLTTRIISTVAGSGWSGYAGDGGSAISAELNLPSDIAFDPLGNLYIADNGNQAIRKVDASGVITTVAGMGITGYSGDGGPATAATLSGPATIDVDPTGRFLFIGDANNHVIRRVDLCPPATAVTISGATSVCESASTYLDASVYGGSWSTSNAAVASVSYSGGLVYGVSAGYVTITYTVTGFCGTTTTTVGMNVVPPPFVDSITGATAVCAGESTTLSIVGLGRWSSSNTAVANVHPVTGIVYGVSAGTATISYSVTGTGGCSDAITTSSMTVNPATAGTITGASTVCVGANTTLSDSVTGGSWSSSNAAVASVNASTGVVYGVLAGSATITYSVTGPCGTATTGITVYPATSAGTITGSTSVCASTTNTLTSSVTGGSWSSSNTAIASVNGTTGVVYGVSAGAATITYSVTGTCGTATTTRSMTVNPLPNAGTISGASTFTSGSTICDFGDGWYSSTGDAGGTWTTSDAGIASITPSGFLTTYRSVGTVTFTYSVSNTCGSATATRSVLVVTLPDPHYTASVSSLTDLCVGESVVLTPTADTSGTWTSSDTSVASVSSSGIISCHASGNATIIYNLANVCGSSSHSSDITVLRTLNAGTISGASTLCVGSSVTLTSSGDSGGSWSSSNRSIASVSLSGGVVSGRASGSATISYTVSNACGSSVATSAVTVNPAASAGTITGSTSVCAGANTSLSSSVTGGTWSTSNAAVASVNSTSGVVYGISAGSVTITYSVTGACGTATTTASITVNPLPTVATLSGSSSVCVGATTTLGASVAGGVWSTSNASVASISTTGVVTGRAAGAATISYATSNTCGTMYATLSYSVNGAPTVGTISGLPTLCVAGSTTYTVSGTTGGTWSNVPTSRASISSSGVLRGIAGGNDTVYYTLTSSCGTATASKVVAIETAVGSPGTLSTVTGLNVGSTAIISSSVAGGTWVSTNTTLATISPSGIITARAAGTDTIKYTVSYACGSAVAIRPFNINGLTAAGTISGPSSVCVGSTITLSSTVSGGTWTSSYGPVASVTSAGVVRGVSFGVVAITYTVGSLRSTRAITVSDGTFGSIAGVASICPGTNTVLTNPTAGGTWSNISPSIGTINTTSGQYFGNNGGNDSVYYTLSTGCGTRIARRGIIVTSAPSLLATSFISGTGCLGTNDVFQNATVGVTGIWSFSNPGMASITVVATPTVTVVGRTAGIDTLKYTVTGTCGLVSVASRPITFTGLPAVGAGTTRSMIIGTSTTLTNTVTGGAWSTVYPTIASVNPTTGAVRARAAGLDTIKYRTTNICGTSTAIYLVTVTASKPGTTEMTEASANDIRVYPNPSGGMVFIELSAALETGASATVTNTLGAVVHSAPVSNQSTLVDMSNYAAGMYYITVNNGGRTYHVKLMKQ